ncbi:MAG: molecular chaperone TorD family protein [Microthrixaceae bacterium]|nr:molecular chaperone TorD family protein [Microthrixaceae bacterium]
MSPEWAEATARSAVYSFLSRSLALPTDAQREVILGAVLPLVERIATGDVELGALLAGRSCRTACRRRDLRRAHQAVFTHIESQDCPPYETAYDHRDVFRQTAVMADVSGFYLAHGVKIGGVERERPDHIGAELEFMAFMARKEAHALDNLGPDEVRSAPGPRPTSCVTTWVAGGRRSVDAWPRSPATRRSPPSGTCWQPGSKPTWKRGACRLRSASTSHSRWNRPTTGCAGSSSVPKTRWAPRPRYL